MTFSRVTQAATLIVAEPSPPYIRTTQSIVMFIAEPSSQILIDQSIALIIANEIPKLLPIANVNSYEYTVSYKYRLYNPEGTFTDSQVVVLVDKNNEEDILGYGIIKSWNGEFIIITNKIGNWSNPNGKVMGLDGFGYISPLNPVESWTITGAAKFPDNTFVDYPVFDPIDENLIGQSFSSFDDAISAIFVSHPTFAGTWPAGTISQFHPGGPELGTFKIINPGVASETVGGKRIMWATILPPEYSSLFTTIYSPYLTDVVGTNPSSVTYSEDVVGITCIGYYSNTSDYPEILISAWGEDSGNSYTIDNTSAEHLLPFYVIEKTS